MLHTFHHFKIDSKAASPKILLPIDASPQSEAAVSLLSLITWPAGTRIYVLTMVPGCLPPAGFSLTGQNVSANETIACSRRPDLSDAKAMAAQAACMLDAEGLTVDTEVCEGRPMQVIVERAMKLKANLIVIGATGFNSVGGFSLESTAYNLAQYTNYSMLLARPGVEVRPLSTILAIDNSREACRAVELLCALSLPNWAKITVISVAEAETENSGFIDPTAYLSSANAFRATQQATLNAAEACVARVVQCLHDSGAQAHGLICYGCPADEILCAAQQQEAALIVIGARGQQRADPYRLGEVTRRIVNCAACSVLMVE